MSELKQNLAGKKTVQHSRTTKATFSGKFSCNPSSALLLSLNGLLLILVMKVYCDNECLKEAHKLQALETRRHFQNSVIQMKMLVGKLRLAQTEWNENVEGELHALNQHVEKLKTASLNKFSRDDAESSVSNQTFDVEQNMKRINRNIRTNRTNRTNRRDKRNAVAESGCSNDGVRAIHMTNIMPNIVISSTSNGLIRHWVPTSQSVGIEHKLRNARQYEMVDNGDAIRIKQDGLYFVYSQVFFEIGFESYGQYQIRLRRGHNSRSLSTCSVVAPSRPGTYELSCYTSVVQSLKLDDKIFLEVTELDSRIATDEGKSFFGLVQLSGPRRQPPDCL